MLKYKLRSAPKPIISVLWTILQQLMYILKYCLYYCNFKLSFYSKNHKIYHGLEFERENENNVLFKEQKPWAIKLHCLGSCTPKGSLGVLEEVYLQHSFMCHKGVANRQNINDYSSLEFLRDVNQSAVIACVASLYCLCGLVIRGTA